MESKSIKQIIDEVKKCNLEFPNLAKDVELPKMKKKKCKFGQNI